MKRAWIPLALGVALLATPVAAHEVNAPPFPIDLCGWYCWTSDAQACSPVIWVLQSDNTFSDSEFGTGTWSFGSGTLTMVYSNGTTYTGKLRQGRAFDGTSTASELDGEWSAIVGDFGCNQPWTESLPPFNAAGDWLR